MTTETDQETWVLRVLRDGACEFETQPRGRGQTLAMVEGARWIFAGHHDALELVNTVTGESEPVEEAGDGVQARGALQESEGAAIS